MNALSTGSTSVVDPFVAVCSWQHSYFRPNEIDAFSWPLYAHFANGPMFVAVVEVALNVEAMFAQLGEHLKRGAQLDTTGKGRKRWITEHRHLLFELKPDLFVFVNSNVGCLRVFARDGKLAEQTARTIADRFKIKPRRKAHVSYFHLLAMNGPLMETTPVQIREKTQRSAKQLALLYGDEFEVWEKSLLSTLRTKSSGTVILRGAPGVGKTSFIRHLFSRLSRTHRFYYLPTTNFDLLTTPTLVEFWREEATAFPKVQKVVVLEDAEALLADRTTGDRGAIANLLNIADGLLGDFLRMQLICSVNCDLHQLDPAIVRSGRLLASWEFKRLSREHASRVASAHGLALAPQSDYSLAEIFCGSPKAAASAPRRTMGFGANNGITPAADARS